MNRRDEKRVKELERLSFQIQQRIDIIATAEEDLKQRRRKGTFQFAALEEKVRAFQAQAPLVLEEENEKRYTALVTKLKNLQRELSQSPPLYKRVFEGVIDAAWDLCAIMGMCTIGLMVYLHPSKEQEKSSVEPQQITQQIVRRGPEEEGIYVAAQDDDFYIRRGVEEGVTYDRRAPEKSVPRRKVNPKTRAAVLEKNASMHEILSRPYSNENRVWIPTSEGEVFKGRYWQGTTHDE